MKVMVRNCARCGKDHEVDFQSFRGHAIVFDSGDPESQYNYWGLCPEMDEPVLLRYEVTEDE